MNGTQIRSWMGCNITTDKKINLYPTRRVYQSTIVEITEVSSTGWGICGVSAYGEVLSRGFRVLETQPSPLKRRANYLAQNRPLGKQCCRCRCRCTDCWYNWAKLGWRCMLISSLCFNADIINISSCIFLFPQTWLGKQLLALAAMVNEGSVSDALTSVLKF